MVRFHETFDDGQAQTAATGGSIYAASELVENTRQQIRREARPAITDGQRERIAFQRGTDFNHCAGRRVHGGVEEQVGQCLLEQ